MYCGVCGYFICEHMEGAPEHSMKKSAANYQIQLWREPNYETLLYSSRFYIFQLLDDIKAARPTERFRVLNQKLEIVLIDKGIPVDA